VQALGFAVEANAWNGQGLVRLAHALTAGADATFRNSHDDL
jgi:hypothetical protein